MIFVFLFCWGVWKQWQKNGNWALPLLKVAVGPSQSAASVIWKDLLIKLLASLLGTAQPLLCALVFMLKRGRWCWSLNYFVWKKKEMFEGCFCGTLPPYYQFQYGMESFAAVVGWNEEQWKQKSSGVPLETQPFLEDLLKLWETWINLLGARLLGLGHSLQPSTHSQLLPHQVEWSVLGSFGATVVGFFWSVF